ncbi:hypothetical protein P3342_004297 [Pyrenophora teres f. teres]|nr:hypothetical protein P3342_004297 [Pyrenophora teres f. teres]
MSFNMSSLQNAMPAANASAEDRARKTKVRNLFEILDVYEPSAEFLAAPH